MASTNTYPSNYQSGIGDIFAYFFVGLIFFALISFFVGIMAVASDRDLDQPQCIYKSYASKYNPAYRAGCELFKVRYL